MRDGRREREGLRSGARVWGETRACPGGGGASHGAQGFEVAGEILVTTEDGRRLRERVGTRGSATAHSFRKGPITPFTKI